MRNVKIAQRGYEAWRRGDLEGAIARFAPDFELQEDPAFPEAGIYHGPEEFLEYARSFLDMFEEWSLEVDELIERGDRVLAFVRWRVRGKASEAEVEMPIAHLWTFREGRAVHMRGYVDPDEAREALASGTASA